MVTQALAPTHPAPARLPPGRRVYAVGDVHGCADRLAALHDAIRVDLERRPMPAVVVHLGDLIDRGTDSAGCIRMVRALALPGARVVNLMGNHEAMLLDALDDARWAPHWLANGGDKALRSWGVDPASPPATWRAALPADDMAFIAGLALSHREGPYLFVHAGLRPGVPLAEQSREDMLWVRRPFLVYDGAWEDGVVVVHGHTPARAPERRANRIGLDTGAVVGGILTCGVLEEDRLNFLFA